MTTASALRHAKIAVKVMLARIGSRCPPLMINGLDVAVGYLAVGRWMRDRGFTVPAHYRESHDLFEAIAADIGREKVLYLEFGVWKGNSIRNWANLLRNPESMLHGFDSFEGLPVDWTPKLLAGAFSTGGQLPVVDDPRIRFVKGWFDETLPRYEWPDDYDRLVVNLDADLYAPTAYVLEFITDRIAPGTVLYFDEFNDHEHELRAFSEFLDKTRMKFKVLGARSELGSVAFERVA